MQATHMVWLDSEGRYRVPGIMQGDNILAIGDPEGLPYRHGQPVATWKQGERRWDAPGKVVPIRHRPGKRDKVKAGVRLRLNEGERIQARSGHLVVVKERNWQPRFVTKPVQPPVVTLVFNADTDRVVEAFDSDWYNKNAAWLGDFRTWLIEQGFITPRK